MLPLESRHLIIRSIIEIFRHLHIIEHHYQDLLDPFIHPVYGRFSSLPFYSAAAGEKVSDETKNSPPSEENKTR